jgi:uncharacterized membrane protein
LLLKKKKSFHSSFLFVFLSLLIHFLLHLSLILFHQSQTTIKSNIPRNKIKHTHKQKSQITVESESTQTWTSQTQFNIIKIKPKSLSNPNPSQIDSAKSILQEVLLTKSGFYSLTKKTQQQHLKIWKSTKTTPPDLDFLDYKEGGIYVSCLIFWR